MKKMIIPIIMGAVGIFCFSAFAGGMGRTALMNTQAAVGPGPGPGTQTVTGFAIGETCAGEPAEKEKITQWDPERAAVPESALVMMTLEGGRGESSGTFRIYTRESGADGKPGSWNLALESAATCGKNGLYKEMEGDKKTPVGVFKMNTPFGVQAAQEGFPENYIQVDDRYYWVGDSNSPMYNRFVREDIFPDFDRSSSEHLARYAGYYNYCIDTGYNPEGTPHKGSAIFLHCMVSGASTSGCVAIPEPQMIAAMRLYREGATYMVIYDREDIGAVY